MPMPFDATLKDLAKTRPVDWVTQLDGPPSVPVELLTPDLSTVSAFTNLVFRVGEVLLHLDFQSGPDPNLPARLLLYNVLLYQQYGLPVLTIVFLLRPRADRSDLTGRIRYQARPGHSGLDFTFDVIRLWEVPVEALLAAGLGVLPLATLGQLPAGVALDQALPGIVRAHGESNRRGSAAAGRQNPADFGVCPRRPASAARTSDAAVSRSTCDAGFRHLPSDPR